MVRALDMGAVDFVNKPFSPKVLLARARTALRLTAPASATPPEHGGYQDNHLMVDTDTRRVFVEGKRIPLTKTEYELLTLLLSNRDQIVTFEQILDQVWGVGYSGSTDYVHVYVSRLRRKIERDPQQPCYLLTERGVGYRFVALEQS